MSEYLKKAKEFAERHHFGVTRKYDAKPPYITHPIRVANLLRIMGADEDVIAAGYLHDVLEDPMVDGTMIKSADLLEAGFRPETVSIVEEVSNPSKNFPELSRKERKEMDRNHIVVSSEEARLLKVADRGDNMYDLALSEDASDSFKKKYYEESFSLLSSIRRSKFSGKNRFIMDELFSVAEENRRVLFLSFNPPVRSV